MAVGKSELQLIFHTVAKMAKYSNTKWLSEEQSAIRQKIQPFTFRFGKNGK